MKTQIDQRFNNIDSYVVIFFHEITPIRKQYLDHFKGINFTCKFQGLSETLNLN